MASTLTNGTYMIRFATMPNETGMYRYDVFIDNELVFIGNTYLEANQNPIIDINDIVMNYNDPLHPYSYGTIAQKSKLLRDVKVKLYLDAPSEIESQILMIYENPYYNSKVTTPILDSWVTNSIGEMPMLQGWNYSNKNGVFLPTYPAVATPNFTFDYLASKQNLPLYHSFSVNYSGGKIDSNVQNFTAQNMSVFQITQPLSWLLRGIDRTETEFINASTLLYSTDTYWEIGFPEDENGVPYISVKRNTNYTPGEHDITKFEIGVNNYYTAASQTITNGNIKSWDITQDVNLNDNLDKMYAGDNVKVFFYDGYLLRARVYFQVRTDLQQELLANGFYTMIFHGEYDTSTGEATFTIKIQTTQNINKPICEAQDLRMLVFSPVNSGVRYEMTVAKFDNKSRFFLKWKDRYGMTQCQPFSGTELYEENFEKTHTKNFKNERKLVQITNQPKWKLNSNWISQDLYPFYESIFVSPWLQLYDAKFDKLYEVLLTDNTYTEKTFKNQGRQLFNLQLEVEQSKTQNILF